MTGKVIAINLYGASFVRSLQPDGYAVTGAKHVALFVLLATAPFGRRTRIFLQQTLWGTACHDAGRQSLRRALADIKTIMGEDFARLITATNTDVTLDVTRVAFVGPRSGIVMEGSPIREPRFVTWLGALRQAPEQLDSLFSSRRPIEGRAALPVLAILPFRTLDAGDAPLADWLAEDMARNLSRARLLNVISHLSSRQLTAGLSDINDVRHRLQAHYCVSGTLRRVGAGLVLDADLIDVQSGHILLTRQIRTALEGLMAAPADALGELIQAVAAAIADDALRHIGRTGLPDVEPHRLLIAGVALMHSASPLDFARSRTLILEAVRRSPHVAEAHVWLAKWHVVSVFDRWSSDVAGDTQAALNGTARALDLSPDNALALTIDGYAHANLLRRLDIAEKRYTQACEANPNESLAWLLSGTMHVIQDKPDDAIEAVDLAYQLSPIGPFSGVYDNVAAVSHLAKGNLTHALKLADRSLAANIRQLSTHRIRVTVLHELGRAEEAREAVQGLVAQMPGAGIGNYLKYHPAANSDVGRRVVRALQASGVS